MENNASYKNIGIESIRIKMFDGIVKTLTMVRRVQELKNSRFKVLLETCYLFPYCTFVVAIKKKFKIDPILI